MQIETKIGNLPVIVEYDVDRDGEVLFCESIVYRVVLGYGGAHCPGEEITERIEEMMTEEDMARIEQECQQDHQENLIDAAESRMGL